VISIAALLACVYAVAVMGYVVGTPEIGVRCAFTRVVNHFYPEYLAPWQVETLRDGDIVTAVGGEEVTSWGRLLRRLAALPGLEAVTREDLTPEEVVKGEAGQAGVVDVEGVRYVRVDFERNGQAGFVWCILGPALLETIVPSVLWLLLKIGLLVFGAIVFWKRPDDVPAARFFLLCFVSYGAFLGGYHWARIASQPPLLLVFMGCATLLPAVTLHFYLVFPRPKPIPARALGALLVVIYGVSLVFLGLFLTDYWVVRGNAATGVDPLQAQARLAEMLWKIYLFFGVAALLYLGSVAALVHSYRTAAGATERDQVRWILIGSAAATIPIGYSLYLAVWEPNRFGGGAATWPMFLASAFVSLAYIVSITRYRLMRLDQLLSSSAGYFVVSTLAGGIYYGIVFVALLLVGRTTEGPSLLQGAAVAFTALMLMIVLDLARGRLMRVLDRHFRREKSQLDLTLQRMAEAVDQLVDPPALARRLLQSSAELLGAGSGAVYLRQGEPAVYRLAAHLGPTPPLTELAFGCPLVEKARANGTYSLMEPPGPALRQLAFLGGALAQGLTHEGQLIGLLILGQKSVGLHTEEDVTLLGAFAQVTALALISAEGHQTIEALNRDLKAKVEKIAEQQRRILALQSQLHHRAQKEGQAPQEEGQAPQSASGMIGSGAAMTTMHALARRVAGSSSAVLIRGESGTGKEVMARLLHESSPRAGKAFVKVHCAALSPTLLESELFGHVKGAFTGAIRDKVGRFEAADGGTLFLDEIGDISLEVQTKLLRVLEEMSFERVGSIDPVQVDVRIIAATHRDLEAMIREGKFREDLYFRLNVISLALPPLRERKEDIPELAAHFLALYGAKVGKKEMGIEDDAAAALKAFHWPGNIRQLENVIERAVVVCPGMMITVADLPEEVQQGQGGWEESSLPEVAASIRAEREGRDRREKEKLVRALSAAGGNKAEAARALGWARSTLVSRLKKHGLS
jgi:transcriptional regulator with GAF, ATPase, and Fis domain